jgi:organic hydroperoxide reductase OsmC/OhrA
MKDHHYKARLTWDGNRGDGTSTYQGYGREWRIEMAGKPALQGSADPAFRGDPERHNPEDLFLAAISSCHLLTYLALCAKFGVNVIAYEDRASGVMREDARGGGKFEEVLLEPVVTIANEEQRERALELHERAHELCYIASSCSVPIRHRATIKCGAGNPAGARSGE